MSRKWALICAPLAKITNSFTTTSLKHAKAAARDSMVATNALNQTLMTIKYSAPTATQIIAKTTISVQTADNSMERVQNAAIQNALSVEMA